MLHLLKKVVNYSTCPNCYVFKQTAKVKDTNYSFWSLIDIDYFECYMYKKNHGYLKLCSECYVHISEQAIVYSQIKQQELNRQDAIRKQAKYVDTLKQAVELKELEQRALSLGVDIEGIKNKVM